MGLRERLSGNIRRKSMVLSIMALVSTILLRVHKYVVHIKILATFSRVA